LDKTRRFAAEPKSIRFYKLILSFYPKMYQKQYGEQMLLVFEDTYQEEIEKNGHVSISFWLTNIFDILASVITQHVDMIQKYGFKKFLQQFHITSYSVIGFILILPFLIAVGTDFTVVLLTGNREAMQPVYHSIFWQPPIIIVWLFGFPALAILLNLIPIFQELNKKRAKMISLSFVKNNLPAFFIVLLALSAIAFVFLHDVIPCTITMILAKGIFDLIHILSVCKNA
jgi:hypothetical protein